MTGYKLNNGNISGLTNLQKLAVLCMKQHRDMFYKDNKAFLVTTG